MIKFCISIICWVIEKKKGKIMDKLYTYLNVRRRELKVSKVEVFNIRLKRV